MKTIYTIIDYCEQSQAFCLYDPISGRSEWVHAMGLLTIIKEQNMLI